MFRIKEIRPFGCQLFPQLPRRLAIYFLRADQKPDGKLAVLGCIEHFEVDLSRLIE